MTERNDVTQESSEPTAPEQEPTPERVSDFQENRAENAEAADGAAGDSGAGETERDATPFDVVSGQDGRE